MLAAELRGEDPSREQIPLSLAGLISAVGGPLANPIVFWGHIGIVEKYLETTIVYWGYWDKTFTLNSG